MSDNQRSPAVVEATASIVASYVAKNKINTTDVIKLIGDVYRELETLAKGEAPISQPGTKPAVPISKSIHDDYIICLEDGKHFKSLKRHLGSYYNLTPQQYRARWNLPADYPMVAPAYAKRRSELARSIGLGRKPGQKLKNPIKKVV